MKDDLDEQDYADMRFSMDIGTRAGLFWASTEATDQQLQGLEVHSEDKTALKCDDDDSFSEDSHKKCLDRYKKKAAMAILESTNAQEAEAFWENNFGQPKEDMAVARKSIVFYAAFFRAAIDFYHDNYWD